MPTLMSNANTTGFLSNNFPHGAPKLFLTAESDDFDDVTVHEWQNEGFNTEYLSMGDGGKKYTQRLDSLKNGLGVGETFAIVAYGDAAAFCLEHYLQPMATHNKLCALIAYYPTTIPDTNTRFPSGVRILVHLAGSEVGVRHRPQVAGIQGKKRIVKKRIQPGIGTGGTLKIAYPTHTYDDADPGFAEHDLDEYERLSAELAWSRTLDVLRRAFRKDVDLERAWEENQQYRYFSPSVPKILATLTRDRKPRVTYTPTLTGGLGVDELRRFYDDFFVNTNPPSMRMRLISRTVGADRVVDELHVSFTHTQNMPWILPGVPPTNKQVRIIIVSIVSVRGGKLYQEHIYWDQASVLVQVGLLDPSLVPAGMKNQGMKRLPVVGREAATRVLDDWDKQASNDLIPGWNGGTGEEDLEEADEADEADEAGASSDEPEDEEREVEDNEKEEDKEEDIEKEDVVGGKGDEEEGTERDEVGADDGEDDADDEESGIDKADSEGDQARGK